MIEGKRGDTPTIDDTLQALRAYQRQGVISDDVSHMADMLIEESDRGVVVILGSLIEDILLEKIAERFVDLSRKQMRQLASSGGPLSSFDSRAKLAFALGVIDDEMVETLNIIRAMRNACAHSRQDISFRTDELRAALSLLFEAETGRHMRAASEESSQSTHRLMFVVAFVIITSVIKGEPLEAATAKGQRMMDAALKFAQAAADKQKTSP